MLLRFVSYAAALFAIIYSYFSVRYALSTGIVDKILLLSRDDVYALADIPVVIICVYLFALHKKRRFTRRLWNVVFGTVATVIAALVIIALFDNSDLSPVVVTGGAYLATIGWLVANYTNIFNAQRAHTMNLLLQMRSNKELINHIYNLRSRYASITVIPREDYAYLQNERNNPDNFKDGKIPVLESITFIANYYEFICVGIQLDDIDERLIRHTIRGNIVRYYLQTQNILDCLREKIDGSVDGRIFSALYAKSTQYMTEQDKVLDR